MYAGHGPGSSERKASTGCYARSEGITVQLRADGPNRMSIHAFTTVVPHDPILKVFPLSTVLRARVCLFLPLQ